MEMYTRFIVHINMRKSIIFAYTRLPINRTFHRFIHPRSYRSSISWSQTTRFFAVSDKFSPGVHVDITSV